MPKYHFIRVWVALTDTNKLCEWENPVVAYLTDAMENRTQGWNAEIFIYTHNYGMQLLIHSLTSAIGSFPKPPVN